MSQDSTEDATRTDEDGLSDSRKFRKGRSGNPAGRPVGAQGRRKIAEQVAREMHRVEQVGGPRYYSVVELLLLRLRKLMLESPQSAFKVAHGFLKRYGPQEAPEGGGYLVVPERLTQEEWAADASQVKEYQAKVRAEWEEKLGFNKKPATWG